MTAQEAFPHKVYRILKPLPSDTQRTTRDPLVSVIVPTLNSERTLKACLQSIRKQSFKEIETVVVDGGSRDATVEIALRLADAVLRLDGERGEARNLGAQLSRGNLLAFIDSDMYLQPDVLEQCVGLARANPTCAIILPELATGEGFWASCRALEKICSLEDPQREAARCFTSTAWMTLNGFDTNLGPAGEDWDLTLRARDSGIPILRISSTVEHDEGKLLLRQCAQKKYYYGKHIAKYIAKHPKEARSQLALLRSSYFRNRRLLARHPINALGMLLIKSVELFAGWLGYQEAVRQVGTHNS